MSAKAERFIVVYLGDATGCGYDEHTLPLLLRLMDSHRPDHRVFMHTSIVGHFRTSKKKLEVVRRLVSEVEALRAGDERFTHLKIGIGEGELIGEFDWLGRVKSGGAGLLGGANNEAARGGNYTENMKSIARNLDAKTA